MNEFIEFHDENQKIDWTYSYYFRIKLETLWKVPKSKFAVRKKFFLPSAAKLFVYFVFLFEDGALVHEDVPVFEGRHEGRVEVEVLFALPRLLRALALRPAPPVLVRSPGAVPGLLLIGRAGAVAAATLTSGGVEADRLRDPWRLTLRGGIEKKVNSSYSIMQAFSKKSLRRMEDEWKFEQILVQNLLNSET